MLKQFGISAVLCLTVAATAWSQEGARPVHILVRQDGKAQGALTADQIQVKLDGKDAPVTGLTPLMQANVPVELVVAIDDSLRGNFSGNLQSIAGFVRQLPGNVAASIGYMQNGRVIMPEGFSTDRERTLSTLRLSTGMLGVSASPYFCLSDLAKNWPSHAPAVRVVVMITNGIDPYNGRPTVLNQNSPYVDEAIKDAQVNRVVVYPIFFAVLNSGRYVGAFSGDNYLASVAEGTGGDMLSSGTMNPVDIKPYLDRLLAAFQRSYIMTFPATPKKDIVRVKIDSKVRGMKVRGPEAIGVSF